MNKQRRTKLQNLSSDLEGIKSSLEEIRDEEQDYYDNIPENLQGSERADEAENIINVLEEAAGAIEDIIQSINEV